MINYLWAISPSILILVIIYLIDKFKEPKKIVFVTFLLGTGFTIVLWLFIIPIEGLFTYFELDPYYWNYWIWTNYLRAAFLEEICKFGVLYLYCLKYRQFNEPMDAIIYGVAVSLGFSAHENISYVDEESMRVIRIFPTLMHASTGIVMGLLLSKFVKLEITKTFRIYLALMIPILMHGTYNMICVIQDVDVNYRLIAFIYFLIGILIVLIQRNKQRKKVWEDESLVKHDNKYFVRSILWSFATVVVLSSTLSNLVI